MKDPSNAVVESMNHLIWEKGMSYYDIMNLPLSTYGVMINDFGKFARKEEKAMKKAGRSK